MNLNLKECVYLMSCSFSVQENSSDDELLLSEDDLNDLNPCIFRSKKERELEREREREREREHEKLVLLCGKLFNPYKNKSKKNLK